jgi:pyruvate formate lyase activating enzyme
LTPTGTIFDIKRFAIHDGPGVRTTVFFKGCPLTCWACHNPEGQTSGVDLLVRDERCNICGDCVTDCPQEALSENGTGIQIDRYRCDLCGACADICLRGALEMAGRTVTVAEVMQEILRDVVYYDESGGGATFSGGEPLFQPDFLLALLRECKEKGITTVVDTSGQTLQQVVESVAGLVDQFLYDVKLMDSDRHRQFTGIANQQILSNLEWLSNHGSDVVVRLPLFPGINDDAANLEALGLFLSSLGVRHLVDILPYHRTGVEKYGRLGRGYKLSDAQPPGEDALAGAVTLLQTHGLHVTVRGESYALERQST